MIRLNAWLLKKPIAARRAMPILAYDANFTGGVRVALADLNGDNVPDIITAPGPGTAPDVKVFDGNLHRTLV